MKKLFAAVLMMSTVGAWAAGAPPQYQTSCFACHSTGAAGAPKAHDEAAWQPRMEKGMPALVESVKKGMNAMPPTGMCSTCTDEDYIALIEFMAAPAPTN
ncbi:MAG: cytochrome c5 family protein [Halioglobus sp.]|nr:cytochrome c5 family protein [Halioglobus sp.]